MSLQINELKEKIAAEYGADPCAIVDLLEISIERLLDAFEDELWENREKFEEDDYEG